MSPQLQTVLLSLGTSLVVSLITFILGLKAGKNQIDRAKIQDLYKKLYSHFLDLRSSAERNHPKSWKHYKKVERGVYSIEYFPPVKEMKHTGDILFISRKLSEEASALELEFMNYSNNLKCVIPKIHETLISDLQIYQSGYKFSSYRGDSNDKTHFETANPTDCRTFRPKDYRDFMNLQEMMELFNELLPSGEISIDFTSGDNPTSYSVKIYPGGITLDPNTYVAQLFSKLEKIPEFNKLCQQKIDLIAKAEKLCKKLSKKAKEPIGFWETIFGAFGDMFH